MRQIPWREELAHVPFNLRNVCENARNRVHDLQIEKSRLLCSQRPCYRAFENRDRATVANLKNKVRRPSSHNMFHRNFYSILNFEYTHSLLHFTVFESDGNCFLSREFNIFSSFVVFFAKNNSVAVLFIECVYIVRFAHINYATSWRDDVRAPINNNRQWRGVNVKQSRDCAKSSQRFHRFVRYSINVTYHIFENIFICRTDKFREIYRCAWNSDESRFSEVILTKCERIARLLVSRSIE